MTLEIIIFILSILFGAFLYWTESRSNRVYRFFNGMMYAKKLQMSEHNPKGFVYKQHFLLRLIYVSVLFLFGILILRFLVPIDLATISIFASCIVGTILGTYLAGFIITSEEVLDTKAESFEDAVEKTIEKGKTYLDDLTAPTPKVVEEAQEEIEETPEQKKSARERLKDKGYLK
ncbi:hypothetical protein [Aegicerativicinus sediminis]|uniref:hypothetical protein n=1 Tax=Aegicerativicinus sediminis TaxID=2893202 RepID=UPI001E578747|nr:hypothetical protein [Aegicerativicinus sediminis]